MSDPHEYETQRRLLTETGNHTRHGVRNQRDKHVRATLDKFPFLREVDIKHWDFILTVAGVFMAASRLDNLRLVDARGENLMETVAMSLAEWDPDGIRGFDDCKGLFESEYDRLTVAGYEPRFIASDAVGKWIVWNVLGRAPETEAECMLIRATGTMVTHAFLDWWKE